MSANRRPPIDWDEALRLHEDEGQNFTEIAREFGYSSKTVRLALLKRGAHGRLAARTDRAARKLRVIWRFMHEKCEKPSHPSYLHNGARGARVASEWAEFEPFYAWARGSGYRAGLRLALRNERAAYGPGNCRWVTAEERVRSRRPRVQRTATRQKPRPIDWIEAKRLYLAEELSMPAVARRIGASYTGIIAGFKRLGVVRPRKPAPTGTAEGTRLHKTWCSMHARCEDPEHPAYPYNGARGTKVAMEWSEFEPFMRWAIDAGAKPGLWLTRIDASRGYTSRNCIWSTPGAVLANKKPPNRGPGPRRLITAMGESKGLFDWAKDPRCHVSATTISNRLALGWDRKTAITAPRQSSGAMGMTFRKVRAFGEVKGPMAWVRDRRCRVGITGLLERLRRGWKAEDAIGTPAYALPAARSGR